MSIDLPGGGGVKFRRRIERELSETKQDVAIQKRVIDEQQVTLAAQQQIINELVPYSMSHLIFKHLVGLKTANDQRKEYLFQGDLEAFSRDLRFLRDHGTINRRSTQNNSPRLVGGAGLRDRLQDNAEFLDELEVLVYSPNSIRLLPVAGS